MCRFTSIRSHWCMLCPNTNGYLTSWVQDHFSQNVPKFGFGDEKMYMKRVGRTSFLPKIPEIRIRGWEENWKKKYTYTFLKYIYVKWKKQRWFVPISSHDAPKFGFGDGKMRNKFIWKVWNAYVRVSKLLAY